MIDNRLKFTDYDGDSFDFDFDSTLKRWYVTATDKSDGATVCASFDLASAKALHVKLEEFFEATQSHIEPTTIER